MKEVCQGCGRALNGDEVAITKKLMNRGATAFYCVACLAAWFEVKPEDIRERIAYFRQTGCTLFAQSGPEEMETEEKTGEKNP